MVSSIISEMSCANLSRQSSIVTFLSSIEAAYFFIFFIFNISVNSLSTWLKSALLFALLIIVVEFFYIVSHFDR